MYYNIATSTSSDLEWQLSMSSNRGLCSLSSTLYPALFAKQLYVEGRGGRVIVTPPLLSFKAFTGHAKNSKLEACLDNPSARLPIQGTVRLLTHVHCKPTHFFFLSFIATISYCLQTSFNSFQAEMMETFLELKFWNVADIQAMQFGFHWLVGGCDLETLNTAGGYKF